MTRDPLLNKKDKQTGESPGRVVNGVDSRDVMSSNEGKHVERELRKTKR